MKPSKANRYRPRRSRSGLIGLSVALAALVVSAVSLFIARQQTMVMDRQLAASVWPAVQFYSSNLRDGEPVIALTLENVGVGPARIERFRVLHRGAKILDPTDFIDECCNPDGRPFRTVTSFVEGRILPAGQTIDFLTQSAEPDQHSIYDRFDRIRGQGELEIEYCYCSVMEDCWSIDATSTEPLEVGSCR